MSQVHQPTLAECQARLAAGQIPTDDFEFAQFVLVLLNGVLAAVGGGGGSGITQLTGDVTAGPGSGSQAATVVAIRGVSVSAVAPTAGQVLKAINGTSASWQAPATTSPGGSNTQVQFNDGGVFGATELQWNASTSMLGFGGLTSSQPGLKASTTMLQVRLADDSDFAGLNAGAFTVYNGGFNRAQMWDNGISGPFITGSSTFSINWDNTSTDGFNGGTLSLISSNNWRFYNRITPAACSLSIFGDASNNIRFGHDATNGFLTTTSGVLNLGASGSDVVVLGGNGFQLGNSATTEVIVPDKTLIIKDSTGTSYKIPCATA